MSNGGYRAYRRKFDEHLSIDVTVDNVTVKGVIISMLQLYRVAQ